MKIINITISYKKFIQKLRSEYPDGLLNDLIIIHTTVNDIPSHTQIFTHNYDGELATFMTFMEDFKIGQRCAIEHDIFECQTPTN